MTRPTRFFIYTIIFSFISCIPKNSSNYFKNFIGFAPTEDVKKLKSYADNFGVDASYWLAFECEDSTVQKIVATLHLRRSQTTSDGLGGGALNVEPTSWWDTSFTFNSKPYTNISEETRLFYFLWHDSIQKKAYFLTGDF